MERRMFDICLLWRPLAKNTRFYHSGVARTATLNAADAISRRAVFRCILSPPFNQYRRKKIGRIVP
jgi:hypothetical protein